MSVFLSSGSPRRSVSSRRFRASTTPSAMRLLDEQARPGAADLALVEEDAVDDPFDRLGQRGVVEDDVGRLASELQA